jgi:predicted hydrocarbon binding protein
MHHRTTRQDLTRTREDTIMTQPNPRPQELALPVASLAALRRALAESVGEDPAARALQRAGVAAGNAFHELLLRASPSGEIAPAGWSESAFWRRFGELFERRGWGRIANESVHPGIAALDAFDWVESEPDSGADRPSCFFTSGLLANLLGRVCDDEIAVLEVECRSRGDSRCRFLYGAPATLDALYGHIRAGSAIDESLAALT